MSDNETTSEMKRFASHETAKIKMLLCEMLFTCNFFKFSCNLCNCD